MKREKNERRTGSVFSGSVMSASMAGQPGWGKHELDVGTDSGSTRPPIQRAGLIIPESDHSSSSPGVEARHPAPWEATEELGPLNTHPATSASPVSPAQAQSQAARLFHEAGRGDNHTPGRVHTRPGSI